MSVDVLSNPELLRRFFNDLIEEKKRKGDCNSGQMRMLHHLWCAIHVIGGR